jgi:predicted lysophospholipase L1 biosynthesis ABC-type transport system permease subunit
MFKRPISLVLVIYIIIGLVIAWEKHYITIVLLKGVLSALLAIFLWWLPLLGVSLHIH